MHLSQHSKNTSIKKDISIPEGANIEKERATSSPLPFLDQLMPNCFSSNPQEMYITQMHNWNGIS